MARYRHPKHGYHLAGYGDDIAALKAAGWVLDEPVPVAAVQAPEPAPAPSALAPEPAVVASQTPSVATPPTIRRGPGRPRKGS
jgi:hypothetical protein